MARQNGSISFEDAPAELIGKRGEGFKYMLMLMNNARIALAFESLGVLESAHRMAAEYAAERMGRGSEGYRTSGLAAAEGSGMCSSISDADERAGLSRHDEIVHRTAARADHGHALRHRLILNFEAQAERVTADTIVRNLLDHVDAAAAIPCGVVRNVHIA